MINSTIAERLNALLEQTPPFDRITEEARIDLLKDVSIEYYGSGEVLLQQGSTVHKGLYIVESGTVRLMDVENQRLLDKCGEGDFFGSFGLLKGGGSIYEAKAVEPTVCALLNAARFAQLYDDDGDFRAYFDSDTKRYVRRLDKEVDVTGAHLLFSRRLHQLIHREPVTCGPEASAREAASIMRREGVGSVLVVENGRSAGILTTRDLCHRVLAEGLDIHTPVAEIMTTPVATITAEASLFEAMMAMIERNLNRLAIVRKRNGAEELVGMLTDRDIAHFRGQDPVATIDRIQHAPSVAELVSIRADTNEQMWRLYRQGLQPEMINRMMSVIFDHLAVRILALAERDLRKKHPEQYSHLPWVWLRLGSSGRREMALNSQQNNALLYADPSSPEEAKRAENWFEMVAARVNEGLQACGFAQTDFVARDARWRKSLHEWKLTFREWILLSDADLVSRVGTFFDLRSIHGHQELVSELKESIIDALNVQAMDGDRRFLSLMAAGAVQHRPPLNFLRRFSVERTGENRNTFDIRERGTLPVVEAARVLALELRFVDSASTFDRLAYAASQLPDMSRMLEEVLDAYRFLVDFRLEEQLRAFESGEEPSNRIDPYALRKVQQNLLRNTFSTVESFQEEVAKRYDLPKKRLL